VPSGSIYTYTANADPKNGTSAIQTSQGVVLMGQYGYFTAAEVAEAANLGYVLQAGIVASAAPGQTIAPTTPALLNLSGVTPSSLVAVDANNNITSGPLVASVAIKGSDGYVGTPGLGGTQLTPAVQSVAGLSGRAIISTVTSGQAAWQADVQAQAAAGLAAGTAYSWSAINPTTGTMLDFGSGVAA
jgi:hypothetical protein